MTQIVTATFDQGVLRPDAPIQLAAGARVRLIVEPINSQSVNPGEALDELDRLCEEVPIDSGGEKLTRDQLHERR